MTGSLTVLVTITSPACASRTDPSADMDRQSRDRATPHLHLTGVNADVDLEAQGRAGLPYGECAANGARRPVEGGQEAVARRVHFAAPKPRHQTAHDTSVLLQQVAPPAVSEGLSERGRAGDVETTVASTRSAVPARGGAGQELLDLVEHLVDVSDVGNRIRTWELEVAGTGNLVGKPSGRVGADQGGVPAMDHESGRLDGRQDRSHVELQHRPEEPCGGVGRD